jgi:hypothetical protein
MTFVTYLALTATLASLVLGGAALLAESGYRFDLRRKQRRRGGDRLGGRRAEDRIAAVSAR